MKHPTYHLRPNKTADRFAFVEAIKRLERLRGKGLSDYTYYGLGGPFLEDFRLLYEFFPDLGMVSIENEKETYERQRFHRPCKSVQLQLEELSSFIARFDPGDQRSIFWLDYTKLQYRYFEEFKALLSTLPEQSMLKLTLRCHPKDYWHSESVDSDSLQDESFRTRFEGVMPSPSAPLPTRFEDFALLLQGMVQVATEQALPSTATSLTFVPVSSFCYRDGAGMFTLTGVVCDSTETSLVDEVFADWEFANLTWERPKLIDVPVLSTKERLHLQHLLPSSASTGATLLQSLGYLIDKNASKSEAVLEQYAAFHRYSPYVLRGVP